MGEDMGADPDRGRWGARVANLPWMAPETKQKALAKLAGFSSASAIPTHG